MQRYRSTERHYRVNDTKHLKDQLRRRFQWLGVEASWVLSTVRKTLKKELIYPDGLYWVRIAKLNKEVRLPADTEDGAINGDTVYAVVRWSKRDRSFSITTILLRRDTQTQQCDALFEPKNVLTINVP